MRNAGDVEADGFSIGGVEGRSAIPGIKREGVDDDGGEAGAANTGDELKRFDDVNTSGWW